MLDITYEAIFVPQMPLVQLECLAESNTAIYYDTHQSSQGVSVTVVNLVHLYMHLVVSDEVGNL